MLKTPCPSGERRALSVGATRAGLLAAGCGRGCRVVSVLARVYRGLILRCPLMSLECCIQISTYPSHPRCARPCDRPRIRVHPLCNYLISTINIYTGFKVPSVVIGTSERSTMSKTRQTKKLQERDTNNSSRDSSQ